MKKKLLSSIKKEIVKQYPNYSKEKIDEVMYGIEGIYLTITKAIIIFIVAFILGIAKELLVLLIAFNLIRLFAFGMHASKSWICLMFSSVLFLGGASFIKYINLSNTALFTLYPILLLIIAIFAPADTKKRPLIKKKRRIKFKILSIIITIIFFCLSILINNNLLINSLLIGLIIECILILPTTYKVFNMPYDNYKTYGLNAK